ncbi:Hsp20/alpha crystallin family protein [Spirosoma agri]|uniref:Hsp20/alpha crystallin family protein n=1 Tax=Spirosoma agri TaxID=1987381 RepID=A0A6M0IQW3_9BACT|nr:Hsp20/alpha crystallin family protein [Spirosoma agri]NEU70709.1 Hsp20/alpha crystallin family protein [Spirosoma agri]
MYNKQAFQQEYKGGCGPMGRGKFSGQWGRGKFGNFWGRHAGGFSQPPVNIENKEDAFVISLFAAGLAKEQVALTVKDDVLVISYQGADASGNSTSEGAYTYQEHNQSSFERSFRLNDKVLTELITASYADGVLKVTLPKNPETNKPGQSINVE